MGCRRAKVTTLIRSLLPPMAQTLHQPPMVGQKIRLELAKDPMTSNRISQLWSKRKMSHMAISPEHPTQPTPCSLSLIRPETTQISRTLCQDRLWTVAAPKVAPPNLTALIHKQIHPEDYRVWNPYGSETTKTHLSTGA